MTKIKPLMPSLREKKRYIVFEAITEKHINSSNSFYRAITEAAQGYIGLNGLAKAGIQSFSDYYHHESQRGVIRTSHAMAEAIKAACCFITEIDGQPALVKSVMTTGMFHKAQQSAKGGR